MREVNALLGESMRQGSTWERTEFSALKSSKKVTKVNAHHPPSPGKEQVIWSLKEKQDINSSVGYNEMSLSEYRGMIIDF